MKTANIAGAVKRSLGPILASTAMLFCAAGAHATSAPALKAEESLRYERGLQVLRDLNNGQPQPVFEAMRKEFPFLADSTASYALGDVWGRQVLDPKSRQLAAMAAFAALGLRGFFKTHAAYALNMGASPEELKEIVYLVTVPAGFPRAIEASQALQELFAERGVRP
jgi:4-carboxymuconolactone decarboxylase